MTPNHSSGGVKNSRSKSKGCLYRNVDSLLRKNLGGPDPYGKAKKGLLIAQFNSLRSQLE